MQCLHYAEARKRLLLKQMLHNSCPTCRMFGVTLLVWICNPDPLSIRIFNPQKQ